MRPYRAPNKRLIARGTGGRFRQWTGNDFGIGVCSCNAISVRPAEPEAMRKNGFIDPFLFNQWQKARICPRCGAKNESAQKLEEAGCTVALPQPEPPKPSLLGTMLEQMAARQAETETAGEAKDTTEKTERNDRCTNT